MSGNTQYVDESVFEVAALELGIPLDKVRSAFAAQVEFTSLKIAEGGLETIMWPYFGKFRPKMSKVYKDHEIQATKEIRKATKTPK